MRVSLSEEEEKEGGEERRKEEGVGGVTVIIRRTSKEMGNNAKQYKALSSNVLPSRRVHFVRVLWLAARRTSSEWGLCTPLRFARQSPSH